MEPYYGMEQGLPPPSMEGLEECYSWVKKKAKMLKREALAINIAIADPRTPIIAKVIACATLFYAASPIDLIPDFIPVLGQLDDLIIVPLGFYLAIRLIPPEVMQEAREQVDAGQRLPKSKLAAACVVSAWIVSGCVSAYFIAHRFGWL